MCVLDGGGEFGARRSSLQTNNSIRVQQHKHPRVLKTDPFKYTRFIQYVCLMVPRNQIYQVFVGKPNSVLSKQKRSIKMRKTANFWWQTWNRTHQIWAGCPGIFVHFLFFRFLLPHGLTVNCSTEGIRFISCFTYWIQRWCERLLAVTWRRETWQVDAESGGEFCGSTCQTRSLAKPRNIRRTTLKDQACSRMYFTWKLVFLFGFFTEATFCDLNIQNRGG